MPKLKRFVSFIDSNPSEKDCVDYLEKIVWKGKTPISPFDPSSKVYPCANGKWKCKNTGKYFTTKSLTIFRHSRLPLKKIFLALHFLVSRKKGIPSTQLAEDLNITQKTAWKLLNKLRNILDQSNFIKDMLKGTVEIDETYVGGSNTNRHWDKKVLHSQGRSGKDKTTMLVMIEKGGKVIVEKVSNVQKNTLELIIRANVKEGSTVYTDEWKAYKGLKKWYNHEIVNHGKKQYVNGNASTNSAENFNLQLKRTINGTYHWISRKHAQKYANEIAFRFNTRKNSRQERFDLALSSAVGKHLTYGELVIS